MGAMAKRRTRRQKEKAKHPNTFSWQPASKNSLPGSFVKRESQRGLTKNTLEANRQKNANLLTKEIDVPEIRKDIVRSLLITSLILASELVIYLLWNK